MKSACVFADTLRNDTEVLLNFNSPFSIRSQVIKNSNFSDNYLNSSIQSHPAGTSKFFSLPKSLLLLPVFLPSLIQIILQRSLNFIKFRFSFKTIKTNSLNSTDSYVFYMEQSSGEERPLKNKTPEVLISKELSGAHAKGIFMIPSMASPEPPNQ